MQILTGDTMKEILLLLFFGCNDSPSEESKQPAPDSQINQNVPNKTIERQPVPSLDTLEMPFEIITKSSDPNRPTKKTVTPYSGDIIDTHFHPWYTQNGVEPELVKLNEIISEFNIKGLILMPTPFQGFNPRHDKKDEPKATLKEVNSSSRKRMKNTLTDPTSAIASWKGLLNNTSIQFFCDSAALTQYLKSQDSSTVMKQTVEYMAKDELKRDLKDPNCLGLGEIALSHGLKVDNLSREDRPHEHLHQVFHLADSEFVQVIFKQLSKRNKWIDLHIEPKSADGLPHTQEMHQSLFQLLSMFPENRVIISHTMMTNPQNLRSWMKTFPNLYTNIKIALKDWDHLEPITNKDGELYEDWAQLFEEMPNRFFIGSDFKFMRTSNDDSSAYKSTLLRYQVLLGSLSAETASKIGYKNAQELFINPE